MSNEDVQVGWPFPSFDALDQIADDWKACSDRQCTDINNHVSNAVELLPITVMWIPSGAMPPRHGTGCDNRLPRLRTAIA